MQIVHYLILLCTGILSCNGDPDNPDFPSTLLDIFAEAEASLASDPASADCLNGLVANITAEHTNWTEPMRTYSAYQTLIHRLADAQEGKCREFLKQFETGFNLEIQLMAYNTSLLRRTKRSLPLVPIVLGSLAAELVFGGQTAYAPAPPQYLCWDATRRRYYNCNGRRKRQVVIPGPVYRFCQAFPRLCALTSGNTGARQKRWVTTGLGVCYVFPILCGRGGSFPHPGSRGKRFAGPVVSFCARFPTLCGFGGSVVGSTVGGIAVDEYRRWREPKNQWCSYWNGHQFVHYQCA